MSTAVYEKKAFWESMLRRFAEVFLYFKPAVYHPQVHASLMSELVLRLGFRYDKLSTYFLRTSCALSSESTGSGLDSCLHHLLSCRWFKRL